jgi:hypothetical protein
MVAPASLPEITMKSTTSPTPAPTTEYSHSIGNNITHIWNIRSSSRSRSVALAADTIADFYLHENMSSPNPGELGHSHIEKAFPRHRALVMASLGSSCAIIARDITASSPSLADACRKRYTTTTTAETARARAHNTRNVTVFTDLSTYQKHHLLSQSALAGLLIARWTGVTRAKNHTIKSAKTHAELTAKYIHSALACEILVGNRYYRNLPRVIQALYCSDSDGVWLHQNVVGSDKTNIMANMTPADVAPERVAATQTELVKIYAAQIDRLLLMVKQYKRGFVSLTSIRTDPGFKRMLQVFWLYSHQIMKLKSNFELGIYDQARRSEFYNRIEARRFFLAADICATLVMVPQLYNYDVVHLFDNAAQTYAKYVKTAKHTSVRLANDGLTAAFLSFAAIEPRMVTAEMAPKHGLRYTTTSLLSCANHIPSRDPLFGLLRVKHRAHIPRTADAISEDSTVQGWNARKHQIGIPRSSERVNCGYNPLHDVLEDIRSGQIKPKDTFWTRSNRGIMITAAEARIGRQAAERAAAEAAAAESADGWIVCSYRKRK